MDRWMDSCYIRFGGKKSKMAALLIDWNPKWCHYWWIDKNLLYLFWREKIQHGGIIDWLMGICYICFGGKKSKMAALLVDWNSKWCHYWLIDKYLLYLFWRERIKDGGFIDWLIDICLACFGAKKSNMAALLIDWNPKWWHYWLIDC